MACIEPKPFFRWATQPKESAEEGYDYGDTLELRCDSHHCRFARCMAVALPYCDARGGRVDGCRGDPSEENQELKFDQAVLDLCPSGPGVSVAKLNEVEPA